jgi:hypothetical protein
MLDAWREKIIVRSKNLPTASGSLVTTAKMKLPRSGHTATLLPDDRVLIAGGMIREGEFLSEAEIYNLANETFEFTGTMSIKRFGHTATLLPNGKVLVTGGWTENQPTGGAEIYDTVTGRFIPTGNMKKPRVSHQGDIACRWKSADYRRAIFRIVKTGERGNIRPVNWRILRNRQYDDAAYGSHRHVIKQRQSVDYRRRHRALSLRDGLFERRALRPEKRRFQLDPKYDDRPFQTRGGVTSGRKSFDYRRL